MARKNEIVRILIERDGMSRENAEEAVRDARQAVRDGEDPEEVLEGWFGLEPDYILEIL